MVGSVEVEWRNVPPVPTRLSGVPSCLRPPCSIMAVSDRSLIEEDEVVDD